MLRTVLPWTLSIGAALAGASVMVAAPAAVDSDVQDRPGIPTKPSVWVENRGRDQAVPVSVQNVAPDAILPVQVMGTARVAIAAPTPLDVHRTRQSWEYLTVSIGGNENPVDKLERLGADGWETTGLLFPTTGSTARLILLKRPR